MILRCVLHLGSQKYLTGRGKGRRCILGMCSETKNMIIAYKLIAILCIVNLLHPDCFEIYNNNAIPFDIICNIVIMLVYKKQLLYDLF